MLKKNVFMVLCALPLCAGAQTNDFRRADRLENNRLEQQLKTAELREKQREAEPPPHERLFEKTRYNAPVFRAADAVVQVLDSTVVTNGFWGTYQEKILYGYDRYGNNISTAYYNWILSAWRGNFKYEYRYDDKGNETMYALYDGWNSSSNTWIASYKRESEYDSSGNETMYASYDWDSSTDTWKGNSKYEYQYDNKGNQTMYASYNWDSSTNTWKGDYGKYEYQFDENNNQILQISYAWDSNTDPLAELK